MFLGSLGDWRQVIIGSVQPVLVNPKVTSKVRLKMSVTKKSGVNFEFEIDVSNEWHDFVMVNKDVMLYGERHNGNNPATINDLLISEVLSTAPLRRDVSTQAHFTYNIDYMNSTQMVIDQILLEDVFTILHPLVFTISDLIQLLQTIIRIQTLNIGIFDSR